MSPSRANRITCERTERLRRYIGCSGGVMRRGDEKEVVTVGGSTLGPVHSGYNLSLFLPYFGAALSFWWPHYEF